MSKLRIAVLSDLHVTNKANYDQSWIVFDDADHDAPFSELSKLIQNDNLTADILICCGDISDKAGKQGQRFAWNMIHSIANLLGTTKVFGTPGNHDWDSRSDSTSYDPKSGLLNLNPLFPYDDQYYCYKYWAEHYGIDTNENYRILNINSCAFHGNSSEGKPEHIHGRISERTLSKIKEELDLQGEYKVNVAFLHHHPLRKECEYVERDYSELKGGQQLLELLSNDKYGSWLIIHGHKHWPDIQFAAGCSTNSPVLFSAASFSSKRLYDKAKHNQFYIIELDLDSLDNYNLPIAGNVLAWNWHLGSKWKKAGIGEGIPYNSGFGNRDSIITIARDIDKYITQTDEPYFFWEEVIAQFPNISYLLPDDEKRLIDRLNSNYNINFDFDYQTNMPTKLCKG